MAGYTTRQMREYMARRRKGPDALSWKSLAEDAAILVAYAHGEVSEGRAAATLGLDRIDLRKRLRAALRLANELTGTPPDIDPALEPMIVDASMAEPADFEAFVGRFLGGRAPEPSTSNARRAGGEGR